MHTNSSSPITTTADIISPTCPGSSPTMKSLLSSFFFLPPHAVQNPLDGPSRIMQPSMR
ncbi:hypothetical protein HDV57DRAFT_494993 [Trichoderma longibrachiatum]